MILALRCLALTRLRGPKLSTSCTAERSRNGLRSTISTEVVTPEAVPGQLDWEEVAKRYEQQCVLESSQSTFDRDVRHKVAKALELLSKKRGAPKDGNALFNAYALQHLSNLAPGKDGRKRHLLDLSNLLEFAVNKCGADKQWLPPAKADQVLLLGTRDDPPAATVAIKPEQLEGLLHSLDEKPELRLAVALVGLYGLRPAELIVLSVEDGDLKVGNVKRNRKTVKNPKPPRLALPLDLLSMPGEGKLVLRLYKSGLVQLPTSIRNAKLQKLRPCFPSVPLSTPVLAVIGGSNAGADPLFAAPRIRVERLPLLLLPCSVEGSCVSDGA